MSKLSQTKKDMMLTLACRIIELKRDQHTTMPTDELMRAYDDSDTLFSAENVKSVLDELANYSGLLDANEGYKKAFYEIAEILAIGARADSPKNVFEGVIKPMIINLKKESAGLASAQQRIAELEAYNLEYAKHEQELQAEIARRDKATGEHVYFYREHNPNNGMKTDWIEVDSMQFGFLQEITDPDTAEFRTLYAAAQPAALPPEIDLLTAQSLRQPGNCAISFMKGANWMREKVKALGCKAIKLPPLSKSEKNFYGVLGEGYEAWLGAHTSHVVWNEAIKRCAMSLKEQGFTVEGE